MDMNKILNNFEAAASGNYEPSKSETSDMKMILESFYDVAQADATESQPQQLDEIASVTMSGDSADEVARLAKLMNGSEPEAPQTTAYQGPPDMPPQEPAMVTPRMMDDIETDEEEPVEEESWDNEPDVTYDDHHKMTKDLSGGLNRQKKSYRPTNGGDNPMALESNLAEELSSMLKQKMSEQDQDGDGDEDFADVQIARMVKSGMSKEEAKKKVKDKEYNEASQKKRKTDDEEVAEKDDDDPCWKNYKMVGTKKKNGKEVPNCVPKESVEEARSDSMSRKFNKAMSWTSDNPGEMKKKISQMSDQELEKLRGTGKEKSGSGSAREFQIKAIDREMKKRGLTPSNESSRKKEDKIKETDDPIVSNWNRAVIKRVENSKLSSKDKKKFLEKIKNSKSATDAEEIHQELDDLGVNESAPKNNPVAKNAGKFNKSQVQTDRKKEMKKGKGVKHKGKDMQMESPVFDRYVKPFLDKTPKQIVEFYDREALNIIDRLSQERRTLAKAGTDTKLHEAIIGKLREGLSALSEDTLTEARGRRYRSSFDIGRTGYGDGRGADLGSDKAAFKRREMEVELGDEDPNNYAVSIGGKQWKVFRSQRSAQKAAATIKAKYGKDTKVYQTAAPASA